MNKRRNSAIIAKRASCSLADIILEHLIYVGFFPASITASLHMCISLHEEEPHTPFRSLKKTSTQYPQR